VRLWRALLGQQKTQEIARYSVNQYANDLALAYNGHRYLLSGGSAGYNKTEDIETSFSGYISGLYKSNGIVFAIILARMLLFCEARFAWFEINENGEDGKPKGRDGLDVLERPWPNGGTGELLARMEQDVSLGGNFYAIRDGNRLRRLRPDWVTIVLTAPPAESSESEVAGYWYHPGRTYSNAGEPAPGDDVYLPGEVCHWSPLPDPDAQYRGMSWLAPVVREVQADSEARDHKLAFFRNGAQFGAIVSAKESLTNQQYKEWKANFEGVHTGSGSAYKTLFLASPVDTSVTTANMQQLDFKVTTGAGEPLALDTRIPTPTGWTTMGEIQVGDQVVGRDGLPARVIGVSPVHHGRPCYRVTFNDRTSVVADGGHLWAAMDRNSNDRNEATYTTEVLADLIAEWQQRGHGGNRIGVPAMEPVKLPARDLLIDPYVLGVWLGDGQTAGAAICGAEEDLSFIAAEIESRGYTVTNWSVRPDRVPVIGLPGGVEVALRAIGVLGNKHIPIEYLRSSIDQRLDLLRGLMDTDGSVGQRGKETCEYSSKLESLARQVAELARSLGYRTTVGFRLDARSRTGGQWRVTFRANPDMNPFLLPRKAARCVTPVHVKNRAIVSIEPVDSVPVRCIATDAPDQLFAVGDSWVLTHNTRLCAAGGVPPIIVGLSEGLASATYSNYGMARRKFGDHWAHPQWKSASQALAALVDAPAGDVRLGVNTKGIAFLREDAKDLAEIQQIKASTLSTLIMAGYTPDSAAAAVEAEDLSLLEHTGLTSVQLVPPGQDPEAMAEEEAADEEEYDVLLEEFRAEFFVDDEIERRRYGTGAGERFGGGVGEKSGRFKKLSDVIVALLKDWDGEGDPLKDYKQPQLKKAAEQLGIDVPPRSTAPKLKSLILQHHGGTDAKPSTKKAPAKKAAPKVDTLTDDTVERLEGTSESEAIALLAGDQRLTSAKLRKVAEALGIDVPEDMRAKSSIQLHIAEHVGRETGAPKSARDRQSAIDSAKRYGDLAAELDELVDSDATPRAIEARLDAFGRRHPELAAELAPIRDAAGSAREIEVENRIRAAFRALRGRTDLEEGNTEFAMSPGMTPQRLMRQGGYVSIADLRDELSDIPRAEQDATLKRIAIHDPGAVAVPESAQFSLTERQRAGALHYGDQDKHWLQIDDPSPRPDARRLARELAESHGVTFDSNAGDVVPLDRKIHAPLDNTITGGNVEVIRPGYEITLPADPDLMREVEVENRIRAAYRAAQRRQRGDWVSLAEIRDELGEDLPRGEIDDALRRIEQQDGANIVPESNQKALTQADRDSAVVIGDQRKHMIHLDDASDRPLPDGEKVRVRGKVDRADGPPPLTGHVANDVQTLSGWKPGDKLIHNTRGEVTYLGPDERDPGGTAGGGSAQWVEFDDGTAGMVSADRLSGYVAAPEKKPPPRRAIPSATGLLPDVKTGDVATWDADGDPVTGKVTRRGSKIFIDWETGRREQIDPTDVGDITFRSAELAPAPDLSSLDTEDLRDTLDLRTVDQLKDMIRDRNKTGAKIKLTGRKRELVDRLVEHERGETPAPPPAHADLRERLATRRQAELMPIASLLGLDLARPLTRRTGAVDSAKDFEPNPDQPDAPFGKRLKTRDELAREIAEAVAVDPDRAAEEVLARLDELPAPKPRAAAGVGAVRQGKFDNPQVPARVGTSDSPIRWAEGTDPGWEATRSKRAQRALRAYGRASFEINQSLRGQPVEVPIFPPEQTAGHVEAIDDLMSVSRTTAPMEQWRGVRAARGMFGDRLDGDLTGVEWREDAYVSTSSNMGVSQYFATQGPGGMLMRMSVPEGIGAAQVKDSRGEAEALLERGLRLRIVADHGWQPGWGYRLVDVEVVRE
jgi:hypothetical protein